MITLVWFHSFINCDTFTFHKTVTFSNLSTLRFLKILQTSSCWDGPKEKLLGLWMISHSHITVTSQVLLWELQACLFQGYLRPLKGSIGCRGTFGWWRSCLCSWDRASSPSDTFSSGTRSWSGVSGRALAPAPPGGLLLHVLPENITASDQFTSTSGPPLKRGFTQLLLPVRSLMSDLRSCQASVLVHCSKAFVTSSNVICMMWGAFGITVGVNGSKAEK